jgi:hypothetical protein
MPAFRWAIPNFKKDQRAFSQKSEDAMLRLRNYHDKAGLKLAPSLLYNLITKPP